MPDKCFIRIVCKFCIECTAEHVTREPELVSKICIALSRHATALGCVGGASGTIRPLRSLLAKMTNSAQPHHITVVHRHFALACLFSKCYSEALPIINRQIIGVPEHPTGLHPYDVVVYLYYGGMIYAGLKQYDDSLHCFNLAFTVSTHGPTPCLVEAFKKYIIISVIVHGSLAPLPRWSSRMQRQLERHVPQYVEVKNAIEANDLSQVSAKVQQHREIWTADNNMGLMKQMLSELRRREVRKLTLTYLTLSIADIAAKTGLDSSTDAESSLLDMVWCTCARLYTI